MPWIVAVIWRPYFPPLVVGGLVLILTVCILWAAARSFRYHPVLSVFSTGMRLVMVIALATVLMGPSRLPPQRAEQTRGKLTLMMDTSASMQTVDEDGRSRFGFAIDTWFHEDLLRRLGRDHDVDLVAFDESPRAVTASDLRTASDQSVYGRSTQVASSVADTIAAVAGDSLGDAVIVLVSDGRDSLDKPILPVARLASARQIPIHTVCLGEPTLRRDLAIVAVPMQEYLFVKEFGHIAVRVVQTNAANTHAILQLHVNGEQSTHDVAFDGALDVTLELPVRQDKPGLYEYQFKVLPIPGEIEKRNNQQSVFLEVISDRFKVLLLEGKPYWDTKFLAQCLRKDDRIELTQITQIAPGRQEKILTRVQEPIGVPQSLAHLCTYDVIILGQGVENVLDISTIAELPKYVSKFGGRLIFARGRAYDPSTEAGRRVDQALSVIEPVIWGRGHLTDQKLELEPAGRMHPALGHLVKDSDVDQVMNLLPPLAKLPVVVREKPVARVLARTRFPGAGGGGVGQPALVSMQYNRGVVLAVLGDGLWRWNLLGKQAERFSGVFDRFWSSMLRWLVLGSDYQPGRPYALRLSQRSVQLRDPLYVELIRRPAYGGLDVRLDLTDPLGQRQQLNIGSPDSLKRHRVVVRPDKPGVYHLVATAPESRFAPIEAKFNVYDVDLERLRSSPDRPAMRRLAHASGGVYLNRRQPDQLLEVLARSRVSAMVPSRPVSIWDRGWVLTLLGIWAGAEWLIRKKGGLL